MKKLEEARSSIEFQKESAMKIIGASKAGSKMAAEKHHKLSSFLEQKQTLRGDKDEGGKQMTDLEWAEEMGQLYNFSM